MSDNECPPTVRIDFERHTGQWAGPREHTMILTHDSGVVLRLPLRVPTGRVSPHRLREIGLASMELIIEAMEQGK